MNLLNALKTNKDARKIFGKKEIEIIDKQLNGIKLTASEQTRLSRDIRKKFEIIGILANFKDDFELKRGKFLKERIENAKEIILESKYFSKIKRIILYGSAAENTLTYKSDIDLAVTFSEISQKEVTEFRINCLGKLPDKIDIQVYNILPNKIKKEIDSKGKTIWKKE